MPYDLYVKTGSASMLDVPIRSLYDGSGNIIEDTYAKKTVVTTVSNNLTSLTNTYNSFISNQWNNRHFAYVGHYDTTTVNLALKARYMIVGAYQDSPPQLTLVNNSGGTTSIQLGRGVTVTEQRTWTTKVVTNGELYTMAGTNEYPAAIRLTGGVAWNILIYKLT